MTFLLDPNALIALALENHHQHDQATRWLRAAKAFATCPITPGGFVRISSDPSLGYAQATVDVFRSLDSIVGDKRHIFWPDDLTSTGPEIRRELIATHGQVTDKYLVALAFKHERRLATFDIALVKAFADEAPW